MTIDKQVLRQLATDAHELGIIKRYTKGIEANKRFVAIATPLTVLALLDELEAEADDRLAEEPMTTNNHPAHGPVSLERLHQIREILSKAAAQSDGGNLGYAMADAVKVIDEVMGFRICAGL